jgi:hypothetical protein
MTHPTYIIRNFAKRAVAHRQQQHEAERQARSDPRIPPTGLNTVLRQYADAGLLARREEFAAAKAELERFRKGIQQPDYFPESPGHAQWITARLTSAPSWTPRVMSGEIKDAKARGDAAYLRALRPLLASLAEYKEAFAKGPQTGAMLVDIEEGLRTPEAVDAEQSHAWADEMENLLGTLEATLNQPNAIEALEVFRDMAGNVFQDLLD